MKHILILGDGMGDHPVQELEGKTPLEAARTPHMDRLAAEGACGSLKTVPGGFPPGSDVANLSILGYNPSGSYTGRGPLEAASLGVSLQDDEIAFRCNLVTISGDILADYSAGHIPSEESSVLISRLEEKFGGWGIRFYAGMSYRHLLVVKEELVEEGRGKLRTTPPHDITGLSFREHLPRERGAAFINDLIRKSRVVLQAEEINEIRLDLGENPANMIWPWGEGKAPQLESFGDRYGIRGAMITAVDLLGGLAAAAGLDRIEVPGATGFFDTDYAAKAAAAAAALDNYDFVYVHIEAPDEAGHVGNLGEKIRAIESIDEKVVAPLLAEASRRGDTRLILLPDHLTPVALKTHVEDPVPVAVWGPGIAPDAVESYDERRAALGRLGIRSAYKLLPWLLEREQV